MPSAAPRLVACLNADITPGRCMIRQALAAARKDRMLSLLTLSQRKPSSFETLRFDDWILRWVGELVRWQRRKKDCVAPVPAARLADKRFTAEARQVAAVRCGRRNSLRQSRMDGAVVGGLRRDRPEAPAHVSAVGEASGVASQTDVAACARSAPGAQPGSLVSRIVRRGSNDGEVTMSAALRWWERGGRDTARVNVWGSASSNWGSPLPKRLRQNNHAAGQRATTATSPSRPQSSDTAFHGKPATPKDAERALAPSDQCGHEVLTERHLKPS